ncbi:hypothetical protein BDR04DRAFT_1104705 [Suillus decipiens]|nr:hypothetical protein BDR04DRAFT_1104705 [Suillus decipiens]
MQEIIDISQSHLRDHWYLLSSFVHVPLSHSGHNLKLSRLVAFHQCSSFVQLFLFDICNIPCTQPRMQDRIDDNDKYTAY